MLRYVVCTTISRAFYTPCKGEAFPLHFHHLPFSFLCFPSSPLPYKYGPLTQLGSLGSAVRSPSGHFEPGKRFRWQQNCFFLYAIYQAAYQIAV